MKIAVITYHQVYNYGSSLQAYATKKTLEKLNCSVEIINYVPSRFANYGTFIQTYNEKKYFNKSKLKSILVSLFCMPSRLKQKKVFKKFDSYLCLNNELSDADMYYNNCYDAYFTGSDQVWNDYYGGFDKIFFLDFVKNKPCFSYSSSFGKDRFNKQECELLSKYLKKYSLISVREKSGLDILKSIGINGIQLLDPIYAIDREEWIEISDDRLDGDEYILVYQLNSKNQLLEKALKLKENKGVSRIIVIEYERRKRDTRFEYVSLPTVNMFISLFRYAKYVVTDSFHGTSFSIKFNREFAVALPPNFEGRIKSVLELFELDDQVITEERAIDKVLSKPIDWYKVNNILSREINKNIQFLEECIKVVEKSMEVN